MTKMRRKFLVPAIATAIALGLFAFQALPAPACGGLIAPDGDVHLARATTFVAWHDGIEHYLTSFTYQGNATNVGWIVPLPAVPLNVEEGGAWTLQRLERETHPVVQDQVRFAAAAATANSAQVLEQVKADLYLLTDEPVNTSDFGALVGQSPVGTQVPGATGFQISFQEKMNSTLYHDLSTDRNMGWVWSNSWVTYLNLDAPASAVTY